MQAWEGGAPSGALPDLVYVVGPHAETCEELRYSLRSVAANLPHRKVWMFGTVPSWACVNGVSLAPHADKYQNIRQSVEAVTEHSEVSEEFVFLNDDMFVVQPVSYPLPVPHLGPIREYLDWLVSIGKRENEWMRSMRDTLDVLGNPGFLDTFTGHVGKVDTNPDCYETHTPLLFNKSKLGQILADWPSDKVFTATGVYQLARAGSAGHLGRDVKVTNGDIPADSPFLSTEDWSFKERPVGDLIRRLFPQKCEYEL